MNGRVRIRAGAATFIGVVLAIVFGEVSDSASNVGVFVAFTLVLGVPLAYFIKSITRKAWADAGLAVLFGVVAFMVFIVYLASQVSGPPD